MRADSADDGRVMILPGLAEISPDVPPTAVSTQLLTLALPVVLTIPPGFVTAAFILNTVGAVVAAGILLEMVVLLIRLPLVLKTIVLAMLPLTEDFCRSPPGACCDFWCSISTLDMDALLFAEDEVRD